jgi:hypothetical protein
LKQVIFRLKLLFWFNNNRNWVFTKHLKKGVVVAFYSQNLSSRC